MLKKIIQQLTHALPSDLAPTRALKEEWHRFLSARLKSLDLLPREEFDTQTRILARLETQIALLEERLRLIEEKIPKNYDTL